MGIKKKNSNKIWAFLILALLLLPFNLAKAETNNLAKEIIDKMFLAVNQLKTISYKLKDYERREGRLHEGELAIKINTSPFWLYAYVEKPSKGAEVLYRQGENYGKALVHPNSFPFIDLNLDPNGNLIRNGSHHNLFAADFNYITDLIRDFYKKSGKEFDSYFKYEGDIIFDNKNCYKISINYIAYKLKNYIVKPHEDVLSIARKLYLSEYKIKELNKLKDYTSIQAGQVLVLPNAYAKKTILYIDKKTFLPLVQNIYDEIGLFEKYECYDVEVNPIFSKEEFSKTFSRYNF